MDSINSIPKRIIHTKNEGNEFEPSSWHNFVLVFDRTAQTYYLLGWSDILMAIIMCFLGLAELIRYPALDEIHSRLNDWG